jgi:type III pantothenate kinase
MILLLDVGNTRIKWAQLLDGSLTPQQALIHRDVETAVWIKQLFRERFRPARLVVASVAGGNMIETIRREAKKSWNVTPEFAESTSVAGGVTNAYRDPKGLGVDRWLAVIAARELTEGGAACVIDAGTAVTIDVVNEKGLHLGGVIIPGVQMMVDSLLGRTREIAARSRRNAGDGKAPTASVFATSTTLGVQNGALLAVAAAADRAAAECAAATTGRSRTLLTGGDAERLQRHMQVRAEVVPDLVLRGLAVLARKS